VLGNASIHA